MLKQLIKLSKNIYLIKQYEISYNMNKPKLIKNLITKLRTTRRQMDNILDDFENLENDYTDLSAYICELALNRQLDKGALNEYIEKGKN